MKWQDFIEDRETILIRVGFLTAIAVVCLGIHFWEKRKSRKEENDGA